MVLDLFQLCLVHSPQRILLKALFARQCLALAGQGCLLALKSDHGQVRAARDV